MNQRQTDHAWDALVAATNANVTEERGALNRALAQIREQSPKDASNEDLGRVITYRANLYRELWPSMTLTATALAKHWVRLPVEHEQMLAHYAKVEAAEQEKNRSKATNQSSAPTACKTCGGDRWVTVRLRAPQQTAWMADHGIKPTPGEFHEEVAGCPDCNPTVVEYWLQGGQRFRSMDADQVREAMVK